METKPVYNSDLHFEHQQWERELEFWEDELKSFQNRLDELVNRWTDEKVLAELSEFQNQFFIHGNKIGYLKERIHEHELNISRHLKDNEDVINRLHFEHHLKMRESMETQREMYCDLKKRFFRFLSKYM